MKMWVKKHEFTQNKETPKTLGFSTFVKSDIGSKCDRGGRF